MCGLDQLGQMHWHTFLLLTFALSAASILNSLDLNGTKKMKKDATFKWDDKDFVNFYTNSANFIVIERQRSIRILDRSRSVHGLRALQAGLPGRGDPG